ncbi:CPBP family glutamic-type intramembrane protease [Halobellus rubicundus]|uniref:Type II CAAX prenyl endopeptidase Rce1 family protein n=1 Tax=Halobellus rubicundus TaxID=2996466 RepID=A0ABD5M787_9EURY
MALTPVTAVGLVVALVGFELLDRLRRATARAAGSAADPAARDRPRATALREHLWKWAVPATLLAVVALEGNTLASIGWRIGSPEQLVSQVAVGLAAMVGVNIATAPLWAKVGDGGESLAAGLGSFAALSVPERLFVAFTAGATEETAFHGYALERLLALTGSPPLAGGISFLAFTLGHVGDTWDRDAVIRIAQPALVTTLLYLWFRSLPALIAIHALNDAVGLLLAERYADETPPAGGDTDASPGAAAGASEAGSVDGPTADADATDSTALEWLRGE